jgi:hypothetical protein
MKWLQLLHYLPVLHYLPEDDRDQKPFVYNTPDPDSESDDRPDIGKDFRIDYTYPVSRYFKKETSRTCCKHPLYGY